MKYIKGQLSEAEARSFLEHIQSGKDSEIAQELIRETLDEDLEPSALDQAGLHDRLDESLLKLQQRMDEGAVRKLMIRKWLVGVAAVLVCLVAAGILWYIPRRSSNETLVAAPNEIIPGQQTATLTLADGRKIKLAEVKEGVLIDELGVRISKDADGQLVYEVSDNTTAEDGYNTLITANGETYKVRLPDGTQVWLNAASSIRYATNFSGQLFRSVELKGEAYFDVTKNAKLPFVVHSKGQDIKVLGTRFNVNCYADEVIVRTTLLEGAVSINSAQGNVTLSPGQQAELPSVGNLLVRKVDTNATIAWINNEFTFEGDDIEAVMRKIARWYDVKVVYQGPKSPEKFGGELSRFKSVHQVLKLLERTGAVKFRIEGKTIYVQ
ncbi:FecR family protein [Sphingobacterium yanglingense]|uniref:FecR family protein n=1 Tax=Sphingobacterium yanglingense TaxID=1437280 RepID=A0A4R6WMG2_9SPHI|nr:FecR family protein [Sphingobacterium yanglingense]